MVARLALTEVEAEVAAAGGGRFRVSPVDDRRVGALFLDARGVLLAAAAGGAMEASSPQSTPRNQQQQADVWWCVGEQHRW
jgi:hypothetical protein